MGRLCGWRWQANAAALGSMLLALTLAVRPGALAQTYYRQTIHPVSATVPAPAATQASPMDEPLRLVALARQSYQRVADYTCILVKREHLKGQLQPEHIIAMKVKTEPFSIHLKWLAPKAVEGQEGCYVAGKHNGLMRVKPTGLLGVVGFVTLDPKDPRVAENSRHSITEAGLGNLIERLSKGWELERQRGNHTLVGIADYEFAKRPCTRVEICRPHSKPGQFYSYRYVIYFDKQNHMPIRAEAYDWPRAGGPPAGELLECYSYINLQFNTGLTDQDFDK